MPITEQENQEPEEAFVAHYGGGQFSFFPDDESAVWSPHDIWVLRCSLLEKAKEEALDGRESIATRLEARDWLLDDSLHAFSATVCCAAAGLNVMAMREDIMPEVDKAITKACKRMALVAPHRHDDKEQETLWRKHEHHESAVCA
ncbi:MAG: hypothetical protein ACYDEV_04135 [Acidiferrobacter sp.]